MINRRGDLFVDRHAEFSFNDSLLKDDGVIEAEGVDVSPANLSLISCICFLKLSGVQVSVIDNHFALEDSSLDAKDETYSPFMRDRRAQESQFVGKIFRSVFMTTKYFQISENALNDKILSTCIPLKSCGDRFTQFSDNNLKQKNSQILDSSVFSLTMYEVCCHDTNTLFEENSFTFGPNATLENKKLQQIFVNRSSKT
uniref:Uncharacterized protein n=1 Tax=Romanomermis culicivorax TaxID=13658 RepID=A0A915L875_ROMCU